MDWYERSDDLTAGFSEGLGSLLKLRFLGGLTNDKSADRR